MLAIKNTFTITGTPSNTCKHRTRGTPGALTTFVLELCEDVLPTPGADEHCSTSTTQGVVRANETVCHDILHNVRPLGQQSISFQVGSFRSQS